ncbi:MAG: DUF4340 domain-containing protein [Gammaproteobacteria bacterium]
MKSRLWLNLALVILIAILASFVYFKPGAKKTKPPEVLTSLQTTDIKSIKIEPANMPAAELTRTDKGWQMVAPLKIPADEFLVKTILDNIHGDVSRSFTAKPADLAQYGLDPPNLRLWLNGTEYDFGGTEPIHNNRYVKTGDEIRLTGNLLFYRINHSPYWWASKRLLPDDAHIIGLQLPDATLTLKGATWQLAPANSAITSDAIQTLVDNWKNAQALSTDKIGDGKPQGEVAIELADGGQPLRFAILSDPNFLILARPDLGLEYQLDSGQRSDLLELKPKKVSAKATNKPAISSSHKSAAKSVH